MALSSKKTIVRLLSGTHLSGYLPPASFLQSDALHPTLDLLDLAGHTLPVRLEAIKYVAFVRDFNLDDADNPERITRHAFLSRPRAEGLWVRLTFAAGDQLEGLAPLDVSFLDALVQDAGVFLTPPDDRTNTHRLYVPRLAIAHLQFVAVITTPSRPKPRLSPNSQTSLFSTP